MIIKEHFNLEQVKLIYHIDSKKTMRENMMVTFFFNLTYMLLHIETFRIVIERKNKYY